MKRMMLLVLTLVLAQVCWAGQELTYVDLVERLADLEHLALLPEPGERCELISSYDTRSRYDEETGEYLDWDANEDDFCESRDERAGPLGIVIREMEGPGCIWRIWSANASSGYMRIYLDGSETPAIDLRFEDYFSGECFPFTFPSMVYVSAKGQNFYMPIPYQKSCKIVVEEGYCQFFHFTYTTFPKGTQVPTFRRDLTVEEASALARADKKLGRLGVDPAGKRPGAVFDRRDVRVPCGRTATVLEIPGEGAITGIRAKMDLPDALQARRILRELTLSITWDGEETPSVWAPFGDFFGTAPGANPYRSLPLGLTEDGWWYSYWYMPFAKGAKVEVSNDGREDQEIAFEIASAPLSKPIENLGRFHAKWHRDAFLPEDPGRRIDWTVLKTSGQGRFCGFMLHVWNPIGGWWGEGDEKYFVDGEKFPSSFGTGSEDYFGYAWGDSSFFNRPYHNQTYNEHNNAGHISVSRWQIVDNVPFHASFEGSMEKFYDNDRPVVYASTVYWYLAPGGVDPYRPVTDVWDRLGYVVTDLASPTTPQPLFVQQGELILETESKGAEIRYTVDGSDPTAESSLYTGPIPVAEAMMVKARTFKEGSYPSMTSTLPVMIVKDYREAERPPSVVKGLQYRYYEGHSEDLSDYASEKPLKTGTADVIDLTPAKMFDEDMNDFALIFEGYIEVPADDVYELGAKADGCQIWIGDRRVLDSNRGVPGGVEESACVALRAGLHPMTVLFFEFEDDQALEVFYRSRRIPKQLIPADVLYRKP